MLFCQSNSWILEKWSGLGSCENTRPNSLQIILETGTCSNDLTERIDGAVVAVRMNEEWRSAYMKEITVIMDAKEEGREEERKNTEAERKRADDAEAIIARYREKYGELPAIK